MNLPYAPLRWMSLPLETDFFTHPEHRLVFFQHRTCQGFKSLADGVFDQTFHKPPTQSVAFQVRPDQNSKLSVPVIRIRKISNDAKKITGRLLNCDERNLSRVVDLCQPRNKAVRQVRGRREQPQSPILHGDPVEERLIQHLVLRTNWSNDKLTNSIECLGASQFGRIGTNRERRSCRRRRAGNSNSGVKRHDPGFVSKHWIDVELPDFRMICGER